MAKEFRKISELHNWEHNPRTITKEGLERLKKQITKLGQYKPLLITKDGTVLGGNMRLKAYQELGVKELWVSVVDAPTEEKKIEYALSDNDRVGKYEGDQLSDLIGNFPDVEWNDYAVDLKEPELVSDIMDRYSETEEDEPPAVEEGEADSKLGEVYTLGRHRLMCGDATKIEDVNKLMDGKKADMVFTDPPYGMDLDTDYSSLNNNPQFVEEKHLKSMQGNKYAKVIGDNKDYDPTHLFTMFPDVKEMFLWGGDYYSERLPLKNEGSWIVWDKRNENEMLDKMFGSQFELCWSKNRHKREIARIQWAGVFGTEKEFDHKRHHPTQKPIALSAWFLNKYSEKDWNVVDLFGGSGSTLIACEQTNRTCFMMELDPHYCDVIRKRYENFINNRQITDNDKS
jgi:DNA modification methylase